MTESSKKMFRIKIWHLSFLICFWNKFSTSGSGETENLQIRQSISQSPCFLFYIASIFHHNGIPCPAIPIFLLSLGSLFFLSFFNNTTHISSFSGSFVFYPGVPQVSGPMCLCPSVLHVSQLGPNEWPIFLKDGFIDGRILEFS